MSRRMLCPTTGKVVFFSEQEVKRNLERQKRVFNRKRWYYKCPECGLFHVTSTKPSWVNTPKSKL